MGWDIATVAHDEVGRRSLLTGPPGSDDDRRADPPFSWMRPGPLLVDYSQAGARESRRQGFGALTHYLELDVVVELRDRLGPEGPKVVALLATQPVFKDRDEDGGLCAPGRQVVAVAGAVHELRRDLVRALASAQPPAAVRSRLAAVVKSPEHDRRPEIDNAALRSGGWVDALASHVEPISADLAVVVARQPAGSVSALDVAVSEALRGFDQAAADLERRVADLQRQKTSWQRGEREATAKATKREREREAEALRELGLA